MQKISVGLVALPEAEVGTLFGVADALAATGRLWQQLTGDPTPPGCLFEPVIVGETTQPFASGFGFPIAAQTCYGPGQSFDIVYIPSLLIHDLAAFAAAHAGFIDWLAGQYERGAVIASACTGTLMLAETGLLKGGEATCHWAAAGLLKARHPDIRLAAQRTLSFAGDDHRLITSGGGASWVDLVLYLIMRYAGREAARAVARVFLFQWHRDGQSPYAAMQRNTSHDDAAIGEAQLWLADNYAEGRVLVRAAARAGLGERTFSRRFRAATGYAPLEYVQLLRIEEAKQMLEQDDLHVSDVALSVGYADEASFRRLFKRVVGITPSEYRRKYAIPDFAELPDHAAHP